MRKRVIDVSTVCLLDGEPYRSQSCVLEGLEDACDRGPRDLVVLPHLPFLDLAGDGLQAIARLARQHATYVALAARESDAGGVSETAVLLDRQGRTAFTARKTHAFPDEDGLRLGDRLEVFETDFGVVGLTVTSDLYFPEVYEVLWLRGAEVLIWHSSPERFRDHSGWETVLAARAQDTHCHFVAAMYADPRTYIANRYEMGMRGAAFGRSMILNRAGTPVADTGHEDGVASARVDLDKRKVDPYEPWVQSEPCFFVNCLGDRTAFAPVATPWTPPVPPAFAKRTARIAVVAMDPAHMWRTGRRPDRLLEWIERAGAVTPDLILLSENAAEIEVDEVGREAGARVAELARSLEAWVVVGGLRGADGLSIAYVWDRQGALVYRQPIYWTRGFEEITVLDTDFARVGIHECGDLYTPMIDRTLTLKGAEIILDPSQMWGASGRHNETLLRARALDNGLWIACAHWNSSDPGLRSVVVDPYGQVVAASGFQREGVVHVDIDFDDQRVFYEGRKAQQPVPGDEGIGTYLDGDCPEQKPGWRQMVLHRRRPALYGVIPTVNDVVRRYRPEPVP